MLRTHRQRALKDRSHAHPRPNQRSTVEDTNDIMIDKDLFFGYCTQFKYLGANFTPELQQQPHGQEHII
jgi:hypothetical protein